MNVFIETTKAISDPNRVCILMALRAGELCVCRLIGLLQLTPFHGVEAFNHPEAGRIDRRAWMGGGCIIVSLQNPASRAWNTLRWIFQSLETSPAMTQKERLAYGAEHVIDISGASGSTS